MPEIVSYIVTETREVKVRANSAADAARIADAAFKNGQNKSDPSVLIDHGPEGIWGNTTSFIRQTELVTKEVRY